MKANIDFNEADLDLMNAVCNYTINNRTDFLNHLVEQGHPDTAKHAEANLVSFKLLFRDLHLMRSEHE